MYITEFRHKCLSQPVKTKTGFRQCAFAFLPISPIKEARVWFTKTISKHSLQSKGLSSVCVSRAETTPWGRIPRVYKTKGFHLSVCADTPPLAWAILGFLPRVHLSTISVFPPSEVQGTLEALFLRSFCAEVQGTLESLPFHSKRRRFMRS